MDNGRNPGDVELSADHLDLLKRAGTVRTVSAGEILYRPGDEKYDFVAVVDARIEMIGGALGDEVVIITFGPGGFLGELNMLTDQRSILTARVVDAGTIVDVPREELRKLLDTEPQLADVLVAAFIDRRRLLREGDGTGSLQILGSRFSPETQALRAFLGRSGQPHRWVDLDSDAQAHVLLERFGLEACDTPVVVTPTGLMRKPTPGELAERLGLTYKPIPGRIFDLVVVGGGPAGLAASVYGSSEGLETVTLEAVGIGGQAGSSSRIENYLGFPQGLSGQDLTERASIQASRFGTHISSPCEVTALSSEPGFHVVTLSDGSQIPTRAVIVATGAEYRRPDVPGWQALEQAGIHYAATETEASLYTGKPVVVLGGGNSAGQAAIFLAGKSCEVTMVVRGTDLLFSMSKYLIDRIENEKRIKVLTDAVVTSLNATDRLSGLTVALNGGRGDLSLSVEGLFCFIGAVPCTEWLSRLLALDDRGFVRTDHDLDLDDLGPEWHALNRSPLPFESSVPGIFAAGDVRAGSVKRVAAAVGEGSSAVRSVHKYLALQG